MEKVLLTPQGEEMLRKKLKHLREVERPQNVRDIEEARAHGDLSENAEYHAAKERQGQIEAMLHDLEDKLGRSQVIDVSNLSGDRVVFGTTVVLFDLENETEVRYTIVGTEEADPSVGKISYSAPLGKALIGKEVGDEVTFKAPGGTRQYSIEDILFGE